MAPSYQWGRWRKLPIMCPIELAADWNLLSWQARGLYCLLMQSADDAGDLNCGKSGLLAVCAFIRASRAEFPAIEPPLNELISTGWLLQAGSVLRLPHFASSQASVTEEGLRKREYRARMGQSQDSPEPVPGQEEPVPGQDREDLRPKTKTISPTPEYKTAQAELYRRLSLLYKTATREGKQVLLVDWAEAWPAPEGLPGEVRLPVSRYLSDVFKTHNPTDAQLRLAGEFLAAGRHWADKGQGVPLSLLVKPPGTNFGDLLVQSAAWSTNGRPTQATRSAPPARQKGGHLASSAAVNGQVPSSNDLEQFLGRKESPQ